MSFGAPARCGPHDVKMLQTFIYFLHEESATSILPAYPKPEEMRPMTNEFMRGCPECYMAFSMISVVNKFDQEYRCAANPAHKFKLGEDGFLKSL